jgi:hypothetical protein
LQRAGVTVDTVRNLKGFPTLTDEAYAVVRMDQPYGNFAKAVLENQRYPNLRDETGTPIEPYDVTAHTLSLLMNVEARPVYTPINYRSWTARKPPFGTPRNSSRPFPDSQLALYKSHVPSMDEGWTRWILEQNKIAYSSLEDKEIGAGNLRRKFQVIVIPDQSPRAILNGYRTGAMPPELTGGVGEEGVRALREFVEQGGTLICLNRASNFAIEQLKLPVRDVTEGLKETEFYVPGSILRTELDTTHAIAAGMPKESIAWAEGSPVFEIKSDPVALLRVKIIARYPADADPLLSGWLLGGHRIRGKAALVEVGLGRGRVYLFGFRPQYRGQSLATYPLLFNAIRQAKSE